MSNGMVPLALAGSATCVALPAATAQRSVPPFLGVPAELLADGEVEALSPQAARLLSRPPPTTAPAPAMRRERRLIRLVMGFSDRPCLGCAMSVGRVVMRRRAG